MSSNRVVVMRAFHTWFYERATARPEAINPETIDEYLRTFSGSKGVLGAMGVYRTAFTTIAQTEPLTKNRVELPVVALGGAKGLGAKVEQMIKMVAANVQQSTLSSCDLFLPEQCPE